MGLNLQSGNYNMRPIAGLVTPPKKPTEKPLPTVILSGAVNPPKKPEEKQFPNIVLGGLVKPPKIEDKGRNLPFILAKNIPQKEKNYDEKINEDYRPKLDVKA